MIFAPPVVGAKERVASLNLCSDLLLLQYLPHDQIAGLTRQASDPTMSPLADKAVLLPNLTTTPEHLVKAQADILLMTQGHAPRIIGKEINKITLGYPGTLLMTTLKVIPRRGSEAFLAGVERRGGRLTSWSCRGRKDQISERTQKECPEGWIPLNI